MPRRSGIRLKRASAAILSKRYHYVGDYDRGCDSSAPSRVSRRVNLSSVEDVGKILHDSGHRLGNHLHSSETHVFSIRSTLFVGFPRSYRRLSAPSFPSGRTPNRPMFKSEFVANCLYQSALSFEIDGTKCKSSI